jgi:hypothetical protein
MALNFETKFTKPLSEDLIAGRIKGAEDFANAITTYYIKTVQDGMPVGVPPTLPAPGLNPLAPPPFTIGVIGVRPNPAKERAMFEILKAYFLAKDVATTKGAIVGLKNSVVDTTNRLNQKKKEITDLAKQVKAAGLEIKNIPTYVKEVLEGVKEIIQEEKDKIQNLQNLFENLKEESKALGVNEEAFQNTFAQELRLINSLKTFKVESFDDFARIPQTIRETKQAIYRLQGQSRSVTNVGTLSSTSDAKIYAMNKITEVALSFEQLSNIVLDPPNFLNYVAKLSRKNPKVVRLYRGVEKLDVVERLVRPELKRLEIELDNAKREVKQYIQPKIDAIKQKVEDKVTELTIKTDDSINTRLYLKVKDRVQDFRTNHEESLKEKKQDLQTLQKAITKSNEIIKKVASLEKSLIQEFEGIKSELIIVKQEAAGSILKYRDLSVEAKNQLAKRFEQPIIPQNLESITPANPLEDPRVSTTNPGEFVRGYERQIDSTADLERTRELRRNAAKNQQAPGPTSEQVYDYMNTMGLGDFSDAAVKVIAEAKTDLDTFKRLFELKRGNLLAYKLTIEDLVSNVQEILTLLQEVSESKGSVGKKVAWAKDAAVLAGNRVKYSKAGRFTGTVAISLKDLFVDIVSYITPYVKKAISWAQKLFEKVKALIKRKVATFEKDVETYLLNLVPLQGKIPQAIEDAQNKKLILDAKRVRAEELKEKAKSIQKQVTALGKAARGAAGLSKNLFQDKNYNYAANEPFIKNTIDGIFAFKAERAGAGDAQKLKAEKDYFDQKLKQLQSIDFLVNGFLLIIQDIQSDSTNAIKRELTSFGESLKGTAAPYVAGFNELISIMGTPVKNASQISKALISVTGDERLMTSIDAALESADVVGFLVDLESRYLGKTRQALRTYVDNPISSNPEHTAMLEEFLNILDKKQSFVRFLLKKLKDIIGRVTQFIGKQVQLFIDEQKELAKKVLAKWKTNNEVELERIRDKAVNVEAAFMSVALGLAARAFWTGTTWTGSTGTNHLTLNIGPFKPIKALPQDGVVSMVEEMAASFENQLKLMAGLVIPPPNTGIVPIPFSGYV